jgi:type II secretory pathway component PulJ
MRQLIRRRGEEGVTLQDVLFAMLITTMLTLALSSVMFAVVHLMGSTETRIDQSNGATLFASYFGPDVQNAVGIATNTTETGSCPSPQPVDLLITTDSGTVSYYRGTSGAATVLYRRTCNGGTATTPARLARFLAAAPTFTCAPDCGATTWRSLTATVIQLDPSDPTNVGKRYTTTIEGSRRAT